DEGQKNEEKDERMPGHAPESIKYKTKGHRVIAMPLCLADPAPPAFTAPCRNQISDFGACKGKRCTRRICGEIAHFARRARGARDGFVDPVTDLSRMRGAGPSDRGAEGFFGRAPTASAPRPATGWRGLGRSRRCRSRWSGRTARCTC